MTRAEEITERFNEYLDRYSPPRHIQGNTKAMQAEVDALLRIVLGAAPTMGYREWLDRLFYALDKAAKTRAWPIVSEVVEACKSIRGDSARAARPVAAPPSDVAIATNRMNAGDPVGESWLYGRLAVELIQSGLVPPDVLRRYRSSWYFAKKAAYGEAHARLIEADAIARHEAAESLGPVPDEATRVAENRGQRRSDQIAAESYRRMESGAFAE